MCRRVLSKTPEEHEYRTDTETETETGVTTASLTMCRECPGPDPQDRDPREGWSLCGPPVLLSSRGLSRWTVLGGVCSFAETPTDRSRDEKSDLLPSHSPNSTVSHSTPTFSGVQYVTRTGFRAWTLRGLFATTLTSPGVSTDPDRSGSVPCVVPVVRGP